MRGAAGVASGAPETAEAVSGTAGGAAGSSILSGGGSMGCVEVADFGCHFLRSGVGALVSGVGTGGGAVAD